MAFYEGRRGDFFLSELSVTFRGESIPLHQRRATYEVVPRSAFFNSEKLSEEGLVDSPNGAGPVRRRFRENMMDFRIQLFLHGVEIVGVHDLLNDPVAVDELDRSAI